MDVYSIMMPMRRPFVHASMTRDHSDGVLVAISVAGAVGTGESAPRPYVTGETTETVIDALSRLKLESIDARIDWSTFETSVQSLIGLNLPQLLAMGSRRSPAAACALETALLDAICRLHGASMFDALSFCSLGRGMLLSAPQVIAATLTIDLSTTPEEVFRKEPALSRGIRHVKIKVGADERSIAKARRFKDMLEPGISTSIDANGAWSLSQALPLCRQLKAAGLGWIEEPLRPRDWEGLRQLRRDSGLSVMLDESFVDEDDLMSAVSHQACDLINVRVSKCGGPLRVARFADLAVRQGLGFQIGVQVGEHGPLWAAGRVLAASLRHSQACEVGRADEWFPSDISIPPFPINRDTYEAPPLPGPGHGLTPGPAMWAHANHAFSYPPNAFATNSNDGRSPSRQLSTRSPHGK